MKLYDFALAPNPRRVRMFLAEKGVTIPVVEVNTRQKEQFAPEFAKLNPFCTVPVLEQHNCPQTGKLSCVHQE